jgi:hypothetical protein
MRIDESDAQLEKAQTPMNERFEPDANAIVASNGQSLKQRPPSFSTDSGICNTESCEQPENAHSSMHRTFESDSNVTLERDRDSAKQYLPSIVTEEGI